MRYDMKQPDDFFRGTDFWMLNDRLCEDELRRQIDEMHDKGIVSFIARTYIGLRSDYPGEEFMAKMRVILEQAKRHGMKVFLQAGYMPEAVLGLPEDCALHYIVPKKTETLDGSETVFVTADGYAYTDVNSVTFLDMFNAESVRYYLLQSYENMWERFSEYYGDTVLSVWVDEPSYNAEYLPYTPELCRIFREMWGYELAPNIPLLFNDEGEYRTVRYHYWRTLEELLEKNYFMQIRDWCHAHKLWFSGHLMWEETMRNSISRACAILPYYKYFDMPGTDRLCAEMNFRYDEIRRIEPVEQRRYDLYTTPIQCTSAAHQAGKEHILCEMYGVSTQNLGFREQKHMFDHFASLGINHRCIHGIFYSLHGRGKRAYPPHISYYQPYWKKYKNVTDYCARVSAFISNGVPVKDTLVLHPLETAYSLYRGRQLHGMTDAVDALDKGYFDVVLALTAARIPFETADEMTLRDMAQVSSDGFTVGEMTYRTVVVPYYAFIRKTTLDKLLAYARAGGEVIFFGGLPRYVDGVETPELAELLSGTPGVVVGQTLDAVRRRLAAMPREAEVTCAGDDTHLQINHRKDTESGTDLFMIFNRDCREGRACTLAVRGARYAEVFDAETGESAPLPGRSDGERTVFPFTVCEGGSVLIEVRHGEAVQAENAPSVDMEYRLDGGFDVSRGNDNVLLLEYCRYKKSEDAAYSEKDYPVLAVHERLLAEGYEGDIFLEFTFESELAGLPLRLALEDPAMQEICLNGVPANGSDGGRYYMAKEFKVINLPDTLCKGTNRLTVHRHFEPPKKPVNALTSLFQNLGGVELENMYLLGDFAVRAAGEYTDNGTRRYSRYMTLVPEQRRMEGGSPELTGAGYPFYAGDITLKTVFECPAVFAGKRAGLRFEGFHGCVAEVRLNGKLIGDVCKAPYELPLGETFAAGENRLEITLTGTLRNLLGPYHRPAGEIGQVWAGYDMPNKPWLGRTPGNLDWEEKRTLDSADWTDSYHCLPFGFEKLYLVYRE